MVNSTTTTRIPLMYVLIYIYIYISSGYNPADVKEQLKLNNYLSSIYDPTPKPFFVTSGQDILWLVLELVNITVVRKLVPTELIIEM